MAGSALTVEELKDKFGLTEVSGSAFFCALRPALPRVIPLSGPDPNSLWPENPDRMKQDIANQIAWTVTERVPTAQFILDLAERDLHVRLAASGEHHSAGGLGHMIDDFLAESVLTGDGHLPGVHDINHRLGQ